MHTETLEPFGPGAEIIIDEKGGIHFDVYDAITLAHIDKRASEAGLSRDEFVERTLRATLKKVARKKRRRKRR